MNHKADKNLIVLGVVDERTAARVAAQRPAHGVGNSAKPVFFRVDFPDFLHTQAEFLRLLAGRKIIFRDDLPGEAAANAF